MLKALRVLVNLASKSRSGLSTIRGLSRLPIEIKAKIIEVRYKSQFWHYLKMIDFFYIFNPIVILLLISMNYEKNLLWIWHEKNNFHIDFALFPSIYASIISSRNDNSLHQKSLKILLNKDSLRNTCQSFYISPKNQLY